MVPPEAVAATMSIDQIALGKIIAVNGQKFVKIRQDTENGSQFQAMSAACFPNTTPYFTGAMQEFDADACNNLPTPGGTCYVYVGTLQDSRDGKFYEVRKFADGKCWMVDNLAYGGAVDGCVNKTTFDGDGSATPTNIFGAGTYGDCRNNPGYPGYLYNWQAAVQNADGWYGNYYQPAQPLQGVCPSGWHLPTGNAAGEFATLDEVNGGAGAYTSALNAASNFWRPGGNWKGTYSGHCDSLGGLGDQGFKGNYWSSTPNGGRYAYNLYINSDNMNSGTVNFSKNYGFPVRCIKDTTERTMQNFTTADCAAYPTPSGAGYTPIGQLKDERDGKSYEVRKFADGKCWMVDNLMYGGVTDNCVGKTAFVGNGSANPSNTFGAGTYGACRDPRVGGSAPCTIGSTTCGYLYNWQAAMQHASAYFNTNYTGPTTNVQGICPQGWHIPSGNTTGEYQALHTAAGSPTTGFWQTTGSWKGVFSGVCNNSGSLGSQGSHGYYWASTQANTYFAYYLYFSSSDGYPGTVNSNKSDGWTIRCIKN